MNSNALVSAPAALAAALPMLGLCSALALRATAATHYTSPAGSDSNPGTATEPWRTIQKAAEASQPGDTTMVIPGTYDERVSTTRGGTNNSRIVFKSTGRVTMKGWIINHPNITVDGFDITRHSAAVNSEAYVRVNAGGDRFELLSCALRDGIGIRRTDMVFAAPNQITSATGGFLDAGFSPGQTISVARADTTALLNTSSYVIKTVDDGLITTVADTVVNDGPKPAYITGAANYGIFIADGADDCIFRGNTLSNLSYRYLFIQGNRHLFEGNIFERNNGWDLIYWMGADHMMRRNYFRNNHLGTYQPSPDIFDNWNVKYERLTFTQNFVQDMIGVINAQKRNSTNSGPLFITHNIFIDVGWFSGRFPDTHFENNTFLRVAKQANTAVQAEKHPLIFDTQDYATGAAIRNNIFVDCGQATGQTTVDQVGWYRFVGPTDTVTAERNFVAGSAPEFGPKTGFNEGDASLNGGDPGFVDINSPLGPDGIPFTSDDGLRLKADSKLRGAGVGGTDVGAYQWPGRASISILEVSNGTGLLDLATIPFERYRVDYSDTLAPDDWHTLGEAIMGTGGTVRVEDPGAGQSFRRFYRLATFPE